METAVNNKVVVLVQEDPSYPLFKDTCKSLGLEGIDPLDFIEPESHTLLNIYKDIFKETVANELMGYLVNKQPILLVWDISNSIHDSDEKLIMVNATLLTEEDIRFIVETQDHVLTYNLEGSAELCARTIYDASKNYRDQEGI